VEGRYGERVYVGVKPNPRSTISLPLIYTLRIWVHNGVDNSRYHVERAYPKCNVRFVICYSLMCYTTNIGLPVAPR